MTGDELVAPLGVARNTAASKGAEIRKILKIDYYNQEWVLPSLLDKNPMVWLVQVDGIMIDAR